MVADRITRKEDKNHDFEPRKIMKSIMQIGKWGGRGWNKLVSKGM